MADFETEEFADGQLVFSAGDYASHLFYIKQGAVQILAESGAVIAEVAQGQSFGETAILKGGCGAFRSAPRVPWYAAKLALTKRPSC